MGPKTTPLGHPRRRAVLCLLSVAALLSVSGCSWLGHSPYDDLTSIRDADPERVAAALTATQIKMHSAPDEPYWPFHMGELFSAVDSTEQAIDHLQTALAIDPAYAPAAALLSKLYYETELYDQAVALLDDFLSRDQDAPDALRAALALHLEALGNVDRAQAVLNDCSASSKEARAPRGPLSRFAATTCSRPWTRRNWPWRTIPAARLITTTTVSRSCSLAVPWRRARRFWTLSNSTISFRARCTTWQSSKHFIFFDEEAGRRWFERYKQYADKDPDDLETLFRTDVTTLSNSEATE